MGDRTPEEMGRQARSLLRTMPKDARSCIINWGDGKTPIPDSVWFGRYSGLMHHKPGSGCMYVLSPLGLAVRAIIAGESNDAHR